MDISESFCMLCQKDSKKGEYCHHLESYFQSQIEIKSKTMKTCKKCNEELSVLEFYQYRDDFAKQGEALFKPYCKVCLNEIRAQKQRCNICEKSLTIGNMARHEKSERHKKKLRYKTECQNINSKNGN